MLSGCEYECVSGFGSLHLKVDQSWKELYVKIPSHLWSHDCLQLNITLQPTKDQSHSLQLTKETLTPLLAIVQENLLRRASLLEWVVGYHWHCLFIIHEQFPSQVYKPVVGLIILKEKQSKVISWTNLQESPSVWCATDFVGWATNFDCKPTLTKC